MYIFIPVAKKFVMLGVANLAINLLCVVYYQTGKKLDNYPVIN